MVCHCFCTCDTGIRNWCAVPKQLEAIEKYTCIVSANIEIYGVDALTWSCQGPLDAGVGLLGLLFVWGRPLRAPPQLIHEQEEEQRRAEEAAAEEQRRAEEAAAAEAAPGTAEEFQETVGWVGGRSGDVCNGWVMMCSPDSALKSLFGIAAGVFFEILGQIELQVAVTMQVTLPVLCNYVHVPRLVWIW